MILNILLFFSVIAKNFHQYFKEFPQSIQRREVLQATTHFLFHDS